MGKNNLDIDDILSRKINKSVKKTDKKIKKEKTSLLEDENTDDKPVSSNKRIKRNEIIHLQIYKEDNALIKAFKNFINKQETTIQEMEESGFFKETEVFNIIYNLRRPYPVNKDDKSKKPQFSWMRAERILEYFGYDIEFKFIPKLKINNDTEDDE